MRLPESRYKSDCMGISLERKTLSDTSAIFESWNTMNNLGRQREKERDRERQRETERDREREGDRETERERETEDGERERERDIKLNNYTYFLTFRTVFNLMCTESSNIEAHVHTTTVTRADRQVIGNL